MDLTEKEFKELEKKINEDFGDDDFYCWWVHHHKINI